MNRINELIKFSVLLNLTRLGLYSVKFGKKIIFHSSNINPGQMEIVNKFQEKVLF